MAGQNVGKTGFLIACIEESFKNFSGPYMSSREKLQHFMYCPAYGVTHILGGIEYHAESFV
jgi:hypothetical protein